MELTLDELDNLVKELKKPSWSYEFNQGVESLKNKIIKLNKKKEEDKAWSTTDSFQVH